MKAEKVYCFRVFTKSEDKLFFESENIKEYKLNDYIDVFNNYFLKELLYYRIDEVGSITKI